MEKNNRYMWEIFLKAQNYPLDQNLQILGRCALTHNSQTMKTLQCHHPQIGNPNRQNSSYSNQTMKLRLSQDMKLKVALPWSSGLILGSC